LVCQCGRAVHGACCPPVLDSDGLAFKPAEFTQLLEERRALLPIRRRGRRAEPEHPNPWHLLRLLGVGGVWRHQDAESKGDHETDGMAPPDALLPSASGLPESTIATANRDAHDGLLVPQEVSCALLPSPCFRFPCCRGSRTTV